MDRAVVRIRSRLGERVGKFFIRIQHLGLEYALRADRRMGMSSLFVQVTVVPTGTVSVCGPKTKLSILTAAIAAEVLSLLLAMTFGEPAHRSSIAIINGAMKPATHMFCFVISFTSFRD